MSKFIEVHSVHTGDVCFVNTELILLVDGSSIRFVDSSRLCCFESHDEIKALILNAEKERG